jgi:DNA-binding CsgD family transcriptional regulator
VADPHDLATAAAAHLRRPGLVVVAGPPGCGRSTLLRAVTAAAPGPAHTGGGLAMLTGVPALALSRAVRARLPAHDVHLLAEAVRSRVRGGLLVLDDLHHADAATVAALPHLATHCRVLVALRTPHRLDDTALRAAATAWLDVPPLTPAAALDLARRTAPQLGDAALHAVAARAGGNPLAVTALARHAAAGRGPAAGDIDQVAYAIATALADLPRPARTALAALGLLGRPAPADLLGAGAGDLHAAGLVAADPAGHLVPVSAYVAETAAGLLDAAARTDLHRRLAGLTPPAEAARHLAAAGDHTAAYRLALAAADRATGGDRAQLLLFACRLPDVTVDPRVRIAAADAALACGRPHAAARVLATAAPLGVEADALRGEALLQAGDAAAARAAVQRIPDAAPAPAVAARDRVLLLAELADDPTAALDTAGKISARHPHPPPGVAAALAAVRAAHRVPGWDTALAAAGGDPLTSRWSAWLLVETLAADGRLAESAAAASQAARACATDLAYGWQTRFLAAADWALALHGSAVPADPSAWPETPADPSTWPGTPAGQAAWPGSPPGADAAAGPAAAADDWSDLGGAPAPAPPATGPARPRHAAPDPADWDPWDDGADTAPDTPDTVQRRAADLTDRALPTAARGYATAAAALVEADTGLLAAARARLDTAPDHPATAWVAREAAWLDGQPDRAAHPAPPAHGGLLTGLHHITARWAAHDTGTAAADPIPADLPAPARRTLLAWATGTGFAAAAHTWARTALREQVRCLLAAGLHDTDSERAVAALLAAERLADTAGLTVLAGRARRGLRRHRVHRDTRSPRSGTQLTNRELDVLRLVAAGEPTRRIAGQLGISAETVDTHIRAGMRKLGARTRTEAAALAFTAETATAGPAGKDRR